jgi:hypothetical protein
MAIAALILGILGGLFGLMLALFGYGMASIAGAVGIGGAAFFKLIMIIIPIAAIVGGALSIAKPLIAGILMLVSAVLVLLVFGFNGFTFLSVLLTGIGGVLAIVASQNSPQQSAAT